MANEEALRERLRKRYRELDDETIKRREKWNKMQVSILEKAQALSETPKLREFYDEAVEEVKDSGDPVTNWNVAEAMAEELDDMIDLSEIGEVLSRCGVILDVVEMTDRPVYFVISLAVAWWLGRGQRGNRLDDFGPYVRAGRRLAVLGEFTN